MDRLEQVAYKGYYINIVETIAGTSYSFCPMNSYEFLIFVSSVWTAKVAINKLRRENLEGGLNETNN